MLRKDGKHIFFVMQHANLDKPNEWHDSSVDHFGHYFSDNVVKEYHDVWQEFNVRYWRNRSTAIRALEQVTSRAKGHDATVTFRIIRKTIEYHIQEDVVMIGNTLEGADHA